MVKTPGNNVDIFLQVVTEKLKHCHGNKESLRKMELWSRQQIALAHCILMAF